MKLEVATSPMLTETVMLFQLPTNTFLREFYFALTRVFVLLRNSKISKGREAHGNLSNEIEASKACYLHFKTLRSLTDHSLSLPPMPKFS